MKCEVGPKLGWDLLLLMNTDAQVICRVVRSPGGPRIPRYPPPFKTISCFAQTCTGILIPTYSYSI